MAPPRQLAAGSEVHHLVLLAGVLGRRAVTDTPDFEAGLVSRLAQGDMSAVEILYSRFGRGLFAYVRSFVRDDGLAEEVVQDTFVAAWRGAAAFEGRSSVSSWLFGIARRQARDRMRRSRPEFERQDELIEMPSEGPGPEASALASASRASLIGAMERIPAADREVLLLTFAHEMSGPEISEVLGIPIGTVKSRLFNARRRLRAQLIEEDVR